MIFFYFRKDNNDLSVVLLADSFLLQLPLEALSFLQHRAVVSVTRDFSLQMLYNRMVKFISVDEAGKGRGKKKEKKKKKKRGLSGSRTRDLSHPKRESYH